MDTIDRAEIHKAVDELTDDEFIELQDLWLKLRQKKAQQGSPWAKEAYDLFEPVREDVRQSGMTEEEINAILDEEIEAVRQELYKKRIAAEQQRDNPPPAP